MGDSNHSGCGRNMENPIESVLMERAVGSIEPASIELRLRYVECDSEGHYAPDNFEKNRCGHCYRTLEYDKINGASSQETDEEFLKSVKSLDVARGVLNIKYLFELPK